MSCWVFYYGKFPTFGYGSEFCFFKGYPEQCQSPQQLSEGSDMSLPTIGANNPESGRGRRSESGDLTRRNSDVANPVESK